MANKVVNLTISLKDGISSKLKGIGRGIKALSSGFMKMAKIGMWAGGAVAAGLGAVAKAYSDQESVDRKMKAAFDAVGESGTKAVATWGAWATAIQRATSLGDEEVMSTITLAKIMGVQNDKLADATKGAIGLSKAFGIDLNSSMKMVALAFQGEYTMLQRYIPALRAAKTDSEKMAVVQAAMANGFKLAEAELGTISGEFKALKGVFWDAMQEFGRVLFGDGGLANGLALVKKKIIELVEGGTITRWAEQAKSALDAVIQTVRILTGSDSEATAKVIGAIVNVIKAGFSDAANLAVAVLAKAIPKLGTEFGRLIKKGATKAAGSVTDRIVARQQLNQQGKLQSYDLKDTAALFTQGNSFVKTQAMRAVDEINDALVDAYVNAMNKVDLENVEKKFIEKFGVDLQLPDSLIELEKTLLKFNQSFSNATEENDNNDTAGTPEPTTPPATPEPQTRSGPETGGFASIAQRLLESGEVRRGRLDETMESIAEFEKKGREAGFTGLGESAADFFSKGESSRTVEKMIQGILDAQIKGEEILGGDIDDPLATTNKILLDIYKVTGGMKTEEGA